MTPEMIENEITQQLIRFSLQQIIQSIADFASSIGDGKGSSDTADGHKATVNLPTVGIIGIGRCGTNIALDVANTIYSANQSTQTSAAPPESAPVVEVIKDEESRAWTESWGERWKKFKERRSDRQEAGEGGLFLIDPVILAADLDGDTSTRITKLNPELVRNFKHFKVTDLQWLYSGGGNIPVVGQYMATLALIAQTASAPDSWKQHRSYMIDSSGLTINRSRLYFYLFSCGGGSGSGMASVFGISQQRARILNIERRAMEDQNADAGSNVSEPICSVGIGGSTGCSWRK